MRVAADQIRACGAAVRQDRLESPRPPDDVIIRQDQAVRGDDHAGAAAAIGVDARDRGRHEIDGSGDGAGVGVEQAVVFWAGKHDSIVRSRRPTAITRMGGPIR